MRPSSLIINRWTIVPIFQFIDKRKFSKPANTKKQQITHIQPSILPKAHIPVRESLGCCLGPGGETRGLRGHHRYRDLPWSSHWGRLKASGRGCLCVCCHWNAAYINRLNLNCQTLKTTHKRRGTSIVTRGVGGEGGSRAGIIVMPLHHGTLWVTCFPLFTKV